jgi:hypothetical protein
MSMDDVWPVRLHPKCSIDVSGGSVKATFLKFQNKACNVTFQWDDEGPGLYIFWSEDVSLVGRVVRPHDICEEYFINVMNLIA